MPWIIPLVMLATAGASVGASSYQSSKNRSLLKEQAKSGQQMQSEWANRLDNQYGMTAENHEALRKNLLAMFGKHGVSPGGRNSLNSIDPSKLGLSPQSMGNMQENASANQFAEAMNTDPNFTQGLGADMWKQEQFMRMLGLANPYGNNNAAAQYSAASSRDGAVTGESLATLGSAIMGELMKTNVGQNYSSSGLATPSLSEVGGVGTNFGMPNGPTGAFPTPGMPVGPDQSFFNTLYASMGGG